MSLLSPEQLEKLLRFVEHADLHKTAVILDVDQTIVHEIDGHIYFTRSIERGLKDIHDLHIPVILNTLRFPLSVIRTLADEWYRIIGGKIPVVLLNGSTMGEIVRNETGAFEYREIKSFPLGEQEIRTIIEDTEMLLNEGVQGIALFYYPRHWRIGEIIWTPYEDLAPILREKFSSATEVICGDVAFLEAHLRDDDICMVYRHFESVKDHLMAYQHSGRSAFITRSGVDKAHGTRCITDRLDALISLKDSLGAGDTNMDSFLSEVGLSLHVGKNELPYRGTFDTVKITDPLQLGELLFTFADMARTKLHL